MKEKIMLIVILSSAILLLIKHQVNNTNNQRKSVKQNIILPDETQSSSAKLIENKETVFENEKIEIDECQFDIKTTDTLTFQNAFVHFRKCLGSNKEFSWKGKSYLTLLAEEVEKIDSKITDSIKTKTLNENESQIVNH